MLARDVEMFIEHCENKGLAGKGRASGQQQRESGHRNTHR